MDPLLIVLVIGCALASVTYAARGFRVRSRTVERHQQALGTLADITQRPDGPPGWSEEPTHQAHVRVIGPSGQVTSSTGTPLPPPRALSSPGSVNPSPFRRPSRTAPSSPFLAHPAAENRHYSISSAALSARRRASPR